MGDCAKADMKDLLPDLLHDRLPPAVREEVRAHLDVCEDCRAELDVLAQVRAMSVAPVVKEAHIAAALPTYRAISPWRRLALSPSFRIAAAIALLVGVGSIGTDAFIRDDGSADTTGTQARAVPTGPLELPIGEALADVTDADLRALLEELGDIEAVTPPETEVVVPSIGRDGA